MQLRRQHSHPGEKISSKGAPRSDVQILIRNESLTPNVLDIADPLYVKIEVTGDEEGNTFQLIKAVKVVWVRMFSKFFVCARAKNGFSNRNGSMAETNRLIRRINRLKGGLS